MDGSLWFLVIAVIVALILAHESSQRAKALNTARANYQEALAKLRMEPASPHLREEALRLGRIYANHTRKRRGVTVFDEVALMNDLNAACAAASTPPAPRIPPAGSRLAHLKDLREQGLITQEEHDERRREILREV